MTPFEDALRAGLMDANVAQYGRVIQRMETQELDASPRYFRERMRLLADPWGWAQRRSGSDRTRLNWRLIAIVAALLLLSACAVAAVTGQFAQWFPGIWMDPKAPEVSEEIVSRMGTVIGVPQTVDGASVTLNAAVWDGQELRLSLTAEIPGLPEDFDPRDGLYDLECRLTIAEDQRADYLRKETADIDARSHIDSTEEEREARVQSDLKWPDLPNLHPVFRMARQEDGTFVMAVYANLYDYVEVPELTLHIENLSTYQEKENTDEFDIHISEIGPDGTVATDQEVNEPFLAGPFDFTFTLDNKLSPITYVGDVDATYENIPARLSKIMVTAFSIDAYGEVLASMDPHGPTMEQSIAMSINGLWTEDGDYVETVGAAAFVISQDGHADCEMHNAPLHVVDPATVTALSIGGKRVELSQLERLDG